VSKRKSPGLQDVSSWMPDGRSGGEEELFN